ncbi:MAG: hypothetical protein ACYSR6_14135 [Planctomycetota bacterium]|jgi:hypothetical protein
MEFGPQQIGKWLILTGIIIALLGGLMIALGRIELFKLPGGWVDAAKAGEPKNLTNPTACR